MFRQFLKNFCNLSSFTKNFVKFHQKFYKFYQGSLSIIKFYEVSLSCLKKCLHFAKRISKFRQNFINSCNISSKVTIFPDHQHNKYFHAILKILSQNISIHPPQCDADRKRNDTKSFQFQCMKF